MRLKQYDPLENTSRDSSHHMVDLIEIESVLSECMIYYGNGKCIVVGPLSIQWPTRLTRY
jgi:hypothetical protein